jgi:hypothetical protein
MRKCIWVHLEKVAQLRFAQVIARAELANERPRENMLKLKLRNGTLTIASDSTKYYLSVIGPDGREHARTGDLPENVALSDMHGVFQKMADTIIQIEYPANDGRPRQM